MRLPVIPLLVAAMLLSAAVYFFTAGSPARRVIDAPEITRIADLDGIETEVAIAPGGDRYAAISGGDLWIFKPATGEKRRVAETVEKEFFPTWTPDGRRITFSRGADTFVLNPDTNSEQLFKSNAAWLSWSPTGRIAFVRDRALWLAEPNGQNEKQAVPADENPDITIRAPRFSPDSIQLAFIKSVLDLRGEIWILNVLDGKSRALVADRPVENPSDAGWILEGRELVYLTNRAGVYALWRIDFAESAIMPLTQPLVGLPLERLGIAVFKDRIVVPRHFVDSNIVTSDGKAIAETGKLEFEPAVSPDGKLVAYTIENENDFEVWTAGIDGSNAAFRAVGHEPRWSPNGFDIVYTHADLNGNEDIWKIDIRNANAERITDADEIDVAADWSPDGRTIAFSSARGGAISIWTIPASGGKRLRLNTGGYGPRFSPDGKSILYWNQGALWTMTAAGDNPIKVIDGVPQTAAGVWTKNGPVHSIPGRMIWPRFDVLPDGRWLLAPIEIRETGLWAVDLRYREN